MKLLLDENLSRRLVPMLTLAYPDSQHVSQADLQAQADSTIWRHAAQQGFIIV